MNPIVIEHFRVLELPDRTIGNLIIPNLGKIYTLEDTVRPYGKKIHGETAIPYTDEGYHVGRWLSTKFNRPMINLYTEEDLVTLQHGGMAFKYIYLHGGNIPEDTYGCILIANNYDHITKKIYGTAEKEVFEALTLLFDEGNTIIWKIIKSTKWL